MPDSFPIPVRIENGNKCGKCTSSLCCTYTTHKLETPRAKADFDYLLWQVSHDNVAVYQDDDGWYMLVSAKCQHLRDPGGLCNIYETRPQICRDHSNDYCDYDEQAETFDMYFSSYEELLQYCRSRFKTWGKVPGQPY